jgi:hypothetical protein
LQSLWPISPRLSQSSIISGRDLLGLILISLCVSTVSASGNYILLRQMYPGLPFRRWLLVTTMTAPSAILAGSLMLIRSRTQVSLLISTLLVAVVTGAIIGFVQWTSLKEYGANTRWWIVASILFWTATIGLLIVITTSPASLLDL